jgi:hypothetical protein
MKDHDINLELDDDLTAWLIITCGNCSETQRREMRSLPPGTSVECQCGVSIRMEGDDLTRIQEEFDRLKDTLNQLGS